MQTASHSDREKFVALIQQHAGGDPTQRYSLAQRLMRYGATYGRLAEDACNGPEFNLPNTSYTAANREAIAREIQAQWRRQQDAIPAKQEKIEAAVEKLCSEFDCKAIFSGDPRGNTLKIEVKSGYSNSWGGEGILVPTS